MNGFYFFDYTYFIFILPALAVSLIAQILVQTTFHKYENVRNGRGVTGEQAAGAVLRANGLPPIPVRAVGGRLTDHFDPRTNTISLSQPVYAAQTVAAVGVAAHEAGHAVQYATGYAPLKLRAALVPVTQIGSNLAVPLVLIGLLIRSDSGMLFINAGILLFCAVVLFQIVTLPVEFDASRRGLRLLTETGILYPEEASKTKKVLSAAAMTYVASVAASLLQLLRLLLIARSRDRD